MSHRRLVTILARPALPVMALVASVLTAGAETSDSGVYRPAPYRSNYADEEQVLADVRLLVGMLPHRYDASFRTSVGGGPQSRASTQDDWDSNLRIALQAMGSSTPLTRGPLIYGVELSLDLAHQSRNGADVSATTGMVGVLIGGAYAFPSLPTVHIELTPLVGLGVADFSGSGASSTCFAWEYGARAGIFYTFDAPALQLGIDARYLVTTAYPSFTQGNVTTDETIATHGFAIAGVVGYRF